MSFLIGKEGSIFYGKTNVNKLVENEARYFGQVDRKVGIGFSFTINMKFNKNL